jgi:membrane-bound ClpP family serine protease
MTSATAIILVVCIVLAATMLAALSHHKKSGTADVELVGSTGLVDAKLDPNGTVLIHGELWRACSNDGNAIATRSKVMVVGMRDHFLLVRLQDH